MADNFNPKHGAAIAIPFSKSNLTTGESNTDLVLAGATTLYVAPVAGSVVAISARASAALTAGTITLSGHSASTEFTATGAPAPVLTSAAQASYASIRPRAIRFAAGATLGISATTTTTLDATNTLDVDAFLHIVLDGD